MQGDVTDWNTRPQPLADLRWRLPLPDEFPEGDLVALGGDLDPSTVINCYRRGIFPMKVPALHEAIAWWSPDPRGTLPLERLRVTRSMRHSAKRYDVRIDTCFEDVIHACADPSREDGWIDDEFIAAYTRLHDLGWAHSVETLDRDGQLAGGLYGIRIDGMFAGESMFRRQRDASKVALMALVDLMRASGMSLLDVQWCNPHLASLGAVAIPRREFLAKLVDAVKGDSPQAHLA